MHQSRRERIKEVFDRARLLPPVQREAYLRDAAGQGPDAEAVLAEVQDLLRELAGSGGPLDHPTGGAAAVAATLIGETGQGPGSRIGPYRLLEQIGEGGFGLVYMAEQERPIRRRVALKVIKLGMDTRQVIARFEQERQALALMDHPNIARVLDAGQTPQGRPYFVMELVRGEPITTFCDSRRLSIAGRLEVFAQVCGAVQHAHQKGIIHRDLKPSNVLVTVGDGNVPVPKVIDFGIAKATSARLTERTLFTEFRQMIGTPEYMSPEQAGMGGLGGVDIDTRSDVYSLGVLLYELLTGVTPFDGRRLRSAAFGELQRIIREVDPPRPSTRLSTLETAAEVASRRRLEPGRLRSAVRGELDWIVMRCLEKDRARRYESPADLARDLERYLTQQPLEAGPVGAAYRARKFIRRNRRMVVAGGLLALTLILGLIGTSASTVWALRERREAEASAAAEAAEHARADENAAQSRAVSYRLAIGSATANLQSGDVDAARRALEQAPAELRGWEWSHLNWVSDPCTLRFDSPADTDALAVGESAGVLLTRSPDGVVRVFELATGRLLRSFQTPKGRTADVRGFVPLAGGSLLLVQVDGARESQTTAVWDTASGRAVWSDEGDSTICGVSLPTGVWRRSTGGAECVDVTTGQRTELVRIAGPPPQGVVGPVHNTRRVVLHTKAAEHVLWDLDEQRAIVTFPTYYIGLQPDEPTLIVHEPGSGLRTIDVVSSQITPIPGIRPTFEPRILCLGEGRFSLEDPKGVLGVYNMADGVQVMRIGVSPSYRGWALADQGRMLFVLDTTGRVSAFDTASVRQPFIVTASWRGAYGAVASPTAKHTAIFGWGDVCLFDAQTGENLWSAYPTRQAIYAAAFSPDSGTLAVAGCSGEVTLLDAATGDVRARLAVPNRVMVASLAWSPDGGRLVAGLWNGQVVEYASAKPDAAPVVWPDPDVSPVIILEFSPDGRWVVSGSSGSIQLKDYGGPPPVTGETVRLRWAVDGREVVAVPELGGPLGAVAFAPNSASLAVSAGDKLSLITVPGGKVLARVMDRGRCDALTFSADGRRLAALDVFHKVRLHDGRDLSLTAEWGLTMWGRRAVRFAPNGGALVVSQPEQPVIAFETGAPPDSARRSTIAQASELTNSEFFTHSFTSSHVRQSIMDRSNLRPVVRDIALLLTQRRGDDPNRINSTTWLLMRERLPEEKYASLVEQARAALRVDPGDDGLRLTLGLTLSRAGRHDEAITELQKVASASPATADTRLAYCRAATALSLAGLGDHAGAAEALADAVRRRDRLGTQATRDLLQLIDDAESAVGAITESPK